MWTEIRASAWPRPWAALTTYGKDEPPGTYADIDSATCFFIIGSNTSEAHSVLFRRIARRKQMEPGVKIIVADPRRTNTSRIADLHIAFRPGTNLALMHSMTWVIINEKHRAKMGKLWGLPEGRIHPKPGYHTVALFEAVGRGDVKCLIICETNQAHTLPNLNKVNAALSNPDSFIVCIEAFPDAVPLQFADLILAPAFWCERDGVYGCGERRYSLTEKAVDPPGQCRPTIETLIEFGRRLGIDPNLLKFSNGEEVWNEWRMVAKGTTYDLWGLTSDRLRKESGIIWPCPTEDHPGTRMRYVRGVDPIVPADHPNRIFFYCKPDGRAAIWIRPYKGAAEEPDAEYPLYLASMRVIDH